MAKNILITGASGLVGSQLTELLLQTGYQVSHLGRRKKTGAIPAFAWDIDGGTIDREAFNGIDTIIHLAGAGVADKRWTSARKKEIRDSRIKSTALLLETLSKGSHSVKTLLSASAIGYYGFSRDQIFKEESKPGNDFLARVTLDWENEVEKIGALGIRIVKVRIGIVLSNNGGALKAMTQPIRLGVGAPLGPGRQFLSWIHINDLCAMFEYAVRTDSLNGVYNAVSPSWATNEEMTKSIAKVLHRPLWLPHVPAFILKMVLGEMAEIVLNGSRVSSEKIQTAGFRFQFSDLEVALNDLLSKK